MGKAFDEEKLKEIVAVSPLMFSHEWKKESKYYVLQIRANQNTDYVHTKVY